MKELSIKHFNGFDYLRVFFACSIVAWHTKALGTTNLVNQTFRINFADFVYANVFLLAVPVFVQVSLFLYVLNQKTKQNYFLKRIGNLAFLFFFWMAVLILIFYKESGPSKLLKPEFWFSGGATPLYFLLVILILTLVTEIFVRLSKILSRKTFLPLIFFMLIFSIVALTGKTYFADILPERLLPFLMSHWSAFNFLPYVFSSIIFAEVYGRGVLARGIPLRWIAALSVIILAVIFWEYRSLPSTGLFKFDGMIIPPYSRLSLILATGLVFSVFAFRDYHPAKIIVFLSSLTLGIYILHVFVMNILAGLLPDQQFEVIRNSPAYFIIVLASSGLTAWLLKDKKIA